jgi:uncharacterized protein involved in exopolysaccharide biosynthesis
MNIRDKNTQVHDSAFKTAWSMLQRRKWLAVLAFVVPFAAAISLVIGLPDLYQAKTTILVQQDTVLDHRTGLPSGESLEVRLQMINAEVLSRARLQELIDRFDLYATLKKSASSEQVIERMRQDIQLEQQKVDSRWGGGGDTVTFTLSYQNWAPETAAQVANSLASFYVEQNELHRPRQVNAVIDDPIPETETVTVPVATAGMNQLDDLKRELAELRGNFSESYPDISRIKAEIATLTRQQMIAYSRAQRRQIDSSVTRAANPSAVQRELELLVKEENSLLDAIEAGASNTGNASQQVTEFDTLRQRYEETKQRRESLSRRYQQMPKAVIADESRPEQQFRVLDPAIVPGEPFAPGRGRLIFMVLVLALGVAGVAVLLAEQLDTSFHRRDDLWSFSNLPILASIPRIISRGDVWKRRLKFVFVSVVVASGIMLLVEASHVLGQNSEQVVWVLAQRGV